MFQKVVINKEYGGFNLSKKALELYKLKSKHDEGKPICYSRIPRDDPHLIEAIEEIGLVESSGSSGCTLKIVQVPVGVEWNIEEFDGVEWVAEEHEAWYPQDDIPQDMTGKKAVVINVAFGGYGLSDKFLQFYKSETGIEAKRHNDIARDDLRLIECIHKYCGSSTAWSRRLLVIAASLS